MIVRQADCMRKTPNKEPTHRREFHPNRLEMSLLAATATYSTAVRRTLGVSAPIVYASRLSHSKSHPAPAKLEKQEIDAEVLRKQLPADVAAMLQAFPSIIRMPVRWGDQVGSVSLTRKRGRPTFPLTLGFFCPCTMFAVTVTMHFDSFMMTTRIL